MKKLIYIFASLGFVGCTGFDSVIDKVGDGTTPTPGTAATKSWDFSTAGDYTYDNALIDVAGNKATLLGFDSTHTSTTEFAVGGRVGLTYGSGKLSLDAVAAVKNSAFLGSDWIQKWTFIQGYFKLDNAVTDDSGLNRVASLSGMGSSYTATSKVGSHALDLNGTSGYLEVTDVAALNWGAAGQNTIGFWMKPSRVNATETILEKRATAMGAGYSIVLDNGVLKTAFTSDVGSPVTDALNYTMNADRWYFVVFTRDSATNTLNLYVNGGLAVSITDPEVAGNMTNASNVIVGYSAVGTDNYFQGSIDELSFWSTDLTAADIQVIYDRQSALYSGSFTVPAMNIGSSVAWTSLKAVNSLPFGKEIPDAASAETAMDYADVELGLKTGLVGLWHFNGSATDGSSLAQVTNPQNITYTDGRFGQAASFDGTTSYVDVTLNAGLNRENVSYSLWFKTTTTGDAKLINIGALTPLQLLGGRLRTVLQAPALGNTLVNDDQWHHVVYTAVVGSNPKVYLDGVHQTEIVPGFEDGLGLTGTTLRFGAEEWMGNPASQYKGIIDEAAIWSRTLTAAEVTQLYRRGANRLKYQVRSCATAACTGISWQGYDGGPQTYFSEANNIVTPNTPTSAVKATALNLTFTDFTGLGVAVANNPYFQYRIIFESDDAALMPDVSSVEIGPTGRYYGGGPTISNQTGIPYLALTTLAFTTGGTCTPGYQLSKDGTSFYYYNGTNWVAGSTDPATSSTGANIQAGLSKFVTQVGTGQLFFRAFLKSNSTQTCEISGVDLDYYN
ncbi:hypothetical protein D3C87_145650 [compost metagenome]